MATLIDARDVRFSYEGSEREAVAGVTLSVKQGEMLAIIGHNGSGKSTLARLLNALLIPASGSLLVCGLSTDNEDNHLPIRQQCAMVFQNPDNQIVATIVEEDVAFGPENLGLEPQEIRRRVDEALSFVKMEDFYDAAPHMLSGGQKQRVAIAGALAMKPKVLILDESTAMLDPHGRAEIMETALRMNREQGVTVLLITHFMDEAAQCDRIIVMHDGRIALEGTPTEVFRQRQTLLSVDLDVPPMAALAYELRELGVEVPEDVLTLDAMVEALCR